MFYLIILLGGAQLLQETDDLYTPIKLGVDLDHQGARNQEARFALREDKSLPAHIFGFIAIKVSLHQLIMNICQYLRHDASNVLPNHITLLIPQDLVYLLGAVQDGSQVTRITTHSEGTSATIISIFVLRIFIVLVGYLTLGQLIGLLQDTRTLNIVVDYIVLKVPIHHQAFDMVRIDHHQLLVDHLHVID